MGKLLSALQEISITNPNELDQNDQTMLDAISHLENHTDALSKLKGTKPQSSDFKTFINPLLDCKKKSKGNKKSWRIVVDMAVEGDTYSKDPMIQICSGEPSYHRFVMTFAGDNVVTTVETECVVKEPDLSVISSQGTKNPQTLAETKDFYDSAQIQRIAVLGSARVFAHPDFIDPLAPEKGQKEPDTNNLWAQEYTGRVQEELNKFLDTMEEEGSQFTTVNGGWAGVKENSTGIPLISNLVGAVSDADHGYSLPPITIMPEVGAFDRVVTRADAYNTNPVAANEETQDYVTPDIYTYFEIPGGWGDDSKYLVGLSTGLVVFEPYGFWTNIEIANGVAQDKPVAIIADPANLKPNGKYFDQMKNDEPFCEVKIPLPGGTEGAYRVYRDAGDASQWIHDTSAKNLENLQAHAAPPPASAPPPAQINNADTTQIFKQRLGNILPVNTILPTDALAHNPYSKS